MCITTLGLCFVVSSKVQIYDVVASCQLLCRLLIFFWNDTDVRVVAHKGIYV